MVGESNTTAGDMMTNGLYLRSSSFSFTFSVHALISFADKQALTSLFANMTLCLSM